MTLIAGNGNNDTRELTSQVKIICGLDKKGLDDHFCQRARDGLSIDIRYFTDHASDHMNHTGVPPKYASGDKISSIGQYMAALNALALIYVRVARPDAAQGVLTFHKLLHDFRKNYSDASVLDYGQRYVAAYGKTWEAPPQADVFSLTVQCLLPHSRSNDPRHSASPTKAGRQPGRSPEKRQRNPDSAQTPGADFSEIKGVCTGQYSDTFPCSKSAKECKFSHACPCPTGGDGHPMRTCAIMGPKIPHWCDLAAQRAAAAKERYGAKRRGP